MYCKCHRKSILEVKCPYNIQNLFIKKDINKCSFHSKDNGDVTINKGHKYYTQVISQIQLSQSNQGYFIVWTTKDSFIQIVGKNEAFWEKVSKSVQRKQICKVFVATNVEFGISVSAKKF